MQVDEALIVFLLFQNQICQNQIRRMDDDNKTLRQQLAQAADRERDLRVTIKELERKLGDVESTVRLGNLSLT